MKTIAMVMMMIMGTATASFAQKNPSMKNDNKTAAPKAEVVKTEAFTETLVTVPARVIFVKGDGYSFSVESENKIIEESVKALVKDGTLYFSLTNGISAEEASENDLTIVITAPGMPEFKISRDMKAEINDAIGNDTKTLSYNK